MSRAWRRSQLVAAIAALAGVTGCASGHLPPGDPDSARNLVTSADVAAQPPGSPQRAFVSWWRDVQYANLSGFAAALGTGRPPEGGPQLLDTLSYVTLPARPTSMVARSSGSRADLRMIVTVRQPVGGGSVVDQPVALRVGMVRGKEGWRLVNGYRWATHLTARLRPLVGGDKR